MIFDAFADHVFPPGANLQQTDDGQQVFFGNQRAFWDSSAAPVSVAFARHKGGTSFGKNLNVFWGTGSTPVGFSRATGTRKKQLGQQKDQSIFPQAHFSLLRDSVK